VGKTSNRFRAVSTKIRLGGEGGGIGKSGEGKKDVLVQLLLFTARGRN